MNPRGFAFLIPEDPKLEDVYVSAEDAAGLLNRDIVEFAVGHQRGRRCGKIMRVLQRGQKEVFGQVQRSGNQAVLVTPQEETHLIKDGHRLRPDEWVIAKIVDYPTPHSMGKVQVVDALGMELLPKYDVPVAIAQFGLPDQFSQSVLNEAEECYRWMEKESKDFSDRRDLRQLPLVTIDGETAKDFDDAVYVDNSQNSPVFKLYVAIADVSFFVRPGTNLDRSAKDRGTSVYFPGTCIPMLPEALSNELCSLKPREERLALTAEIHLDREGNVTNTFFYEALIKTIRRLTYTEVERFHQGNRAGLEDVAGPLTAAFALFKKLLHQRQQRGVLDFDLPECQIIVDADGNPVEVKKGERFDAHKLIEEFMILANREVARALKEGKVAALYRVHENPAPTTVEEINALMRNLGIPQRITSSAPKSVAKILHDTLNVKGAKALHQAILRMQKQAKYMADPLGHYGLALKDYTHFTSPIRRYPDLVVHRALKQLIYSGKDSDIEDGDLQEFDRLGEQTSERERRAMEAERFVVKRKQCWFMQKHLGETFVGVISGLIAKGLFVEIPQFALDGFLPIEEMSGVYEYDEQRVCFRRRPGHSILTVGDSVKITVAEVSVEAGEITFIEAKP